MSLHHKYLCFSLCLLFNFSIAQAQGDPRFNVSVSFETASPPSVKEQVQQALPILWNRIIAQQARATMPNSIEAMNFLRSLHPQQDGSIIQFNPDRVWSYLEKEGVPHIQVLPSFHLRFELRNASGSRMQASEHALLTYIQQQTDAFGIVLNSNAPLLAIDIQWLDDTQVQLSVRGQSKLAEFSETRSLNSGNPFIQLQDWVMQTIIHARDAYAWQQKITLETVNPDSTNSPIDTTGLTLHLTIKREANLSEQIALESALEADPRIQYVLPSYLNYHSREYVLQLKKADDSWIADWFAQRGMLASPSIQGWLIQ